MSDNDASFADLAEDLRVVPVPALRLYVWVDPYSVSYGSSLLFAVAHSEEEARAVASRGIPYSYGQYEDTPRDERSDWRPRLAAKLGKPTRVVDLPCAEWHEWSE